MSKTSQEESFMNVMFQEELNGENVAKGHDSYYKKFVDGGKCFKLAPLLGE